MAKIPGQLEDAQLHNKSADPAVLPTGKIWIRTDTNEVNFYDGTATRTVVTKAQTQTLTNKTLSGNTAATLINGSGTVAINSSGTVTLPNATDTLVGKATTDTFTNKTIDAAGTGNSITNIADANVKAAAGIALNKLAATTVSRALVSDASGFVSPSAVTSTTLAFLDATSSVQTQINAQIPKSTVTTKGDVLAATASATIARLGVGTDGQALLADSAQTTGLRWGAPTATAAWNYLSKTAGYSAVINDFVMCSSSSFTVTLPTAASVSGQMIAIKHNGTSLSQVYTLNTTSAQTIGGIASGSYVLCTNGETLVVVSDGSNWQIVDHLTATKSVSAGTIYISATSAYVFTVTAANATAGAVYSNNGQTFVVTTTISGGTSLTCSGTGTPGASGTLTKVSGTGDATITFSSKTVTGVPTQGTTTTNDVSWYRIGNIGVVTYRLAISVGGSNGTGAYALYLPTGMTLDTTLITPVMAVQIPGYGNALTMAMVPTTGGLANTAGTAYIQDIKAAFISDSSFITGGSNTYTGSANWDPSHVGMTTIALNITISLPVKNWQP